MLERRGRAFYQQVATQSQHAAVREFFETMAEEEARHIAVLGDQYKSVAQGGRFVALDPSDTGTQPLAEVILSSELKQRIASAEYEAAAVSAAVLMEEKAIATYERCAAEATDLGEKALFKWLARWEQGHLSFLAGLEREIKERLWHDSHFWPT
jgi:rubrerythrin